MSETLSKHFVTFYSPGTFVAEQSEKPIGSWDVKAAQAMAATIKERYGATPYGFRFTTRSRGPDDLDSKVTATSPMYYVGGVIRTVEEVEAAAKSDERILLANMRGNHWDRIVQKAPNQPGWRWTQPLREGDVVLPA